VASTDSVFLLAASASAAPFNWALLLNGIQLCVIIGATLIAYVTYRDAQRREKTNNSFHHIAKQTRDHDVIQMFEEFRRVRSELRDGHQGAFGLKQVEGKVIDHHQRALNAEDVVKKVFNYYEATAIGMKQSALEEQIIKDWWRRSYVLDWTDFAAYVREKRERDDAPKLYLEYETYVNRWANDDERPDI